MIDHVNIGVRDPAASRASYERALAPLGIAFVMESFAGLGFGRGGRPQSGPVHVAFEAQDRATVDAFHASAIAGGRDNGPPGLPAI